MTKQRTFVRTAALLGALALCLVNCENDDPAASDDETGADDGSGDGGVCDPVGSTPEVGALLNAPVAADVEVIQKTPQHPGLAGPTDLP